MSPHGAEQRANRDPTRDLAEYLHRRLQHLRCCNTEIESKLSADAVDLCRMIDDGVYRKTDPVVARIIFQLEYVVRNTFRYTMLVGVCSFLEEAVKEITMRLVTDYDAKLKARKRGTWLNKHAEILARHAGIETDSLQSELSTFNDMIALRNCVVHGWGKLRNARNSDAVRAATDRIETAEVSKDDFLVLGDQIIPHAIHVAERIADWFLSTGLNVSIT